MKKGIVLGLIFLLIMMSFTSISGNQINKQITKPSFRGSILYVGGSGPDNYTTIQSAIDDAMEGDTVFVYNDSSPYYENILIGKSINLIGENKNTTIIDGGGSGIGVYIPKNWVNISGFTITNNEFGILLENCYSHSNTITGNIISSNKYWGINLDSATSYNIISGNTLSDNDIGLHLHHSYRNTITGNYILFNRDYGISLHFLCNKTTISNINYDIQDYSKGDNIIYNNYFNNNINAWDDGENIWNITKTSGTNIVGGKWLGGNYWSSYTGEDLDGDGLGDTELPHKEQIKNGGDWLPLIYLQQPSKPIINGPTHGIVGKPYDYTFMSIDYSCDNLSYYILWGDGDTSETVGPSGENVTVSYTWTSQGIYTIKAKAENFYGYESRWATFTVTLPRDKATNNMLSLRILERFPLLQKLIQQLSFGL
jgi:parallel beta-helix repeat protein